MKKKLLSIILAIAMSVSAFGVLVGCDEENTPGQGQNQEQNQGSGGGNNQGNNQGNNEGNQNKPEDDKGNEGENQNTPTKPEDGKEESQTKPEGDKEEGEQKPEDDKEEGGQEKPEDKKPTYNAGDKIEDESTLNALILSLHPETKSLEGLMTLDGVFHCLGEREGYSQNIKTEVDLLADIESKGVDVIAVRKLLATDSEENIIEGSTGYYAAYYLRGNTQYLSKTSDSIQEDISLDKLKEKYEDLPVKADTEEEQVFAMLMPVVSMGMKLVENLAIYSENDFYKTETGYSLSVDLLGEEGILSKVFADVEMLLDVIDLEKTTLNELVEMPQVSKIIQTLLNGITAEEVYNFIDFYLQTEGRENFFPATKDGQTAFDYLKVLLNDPSLQDEEDGPNGNFTLNQFFNLNMTKEEIKHKLTEEKEYLEANFKAGIEQWLLAIQGKRGDFTDPKASLNFIFDENKAFEKIELSYCGDVSNSIEGEEFEGSVQFKFEVAPKADRAELEDMSKVKIRRVKDCNLSTTCDIHLVGRTSGELETIEDAYSLSLVVADEKVTFKVESELFPELNFEYTESIYELNKSIEFEQMLSEESIIEYLNKLGYEQVFVYDDEVVFVTEQGDCSLERPWFHISLSASNGKFYVYSRGNESMMKDAEEFFEQIREIESEVVSKN